MPTIVIKNLPEFNRTLTEYAQLSRRSEAVIVNTKAFYIARRAAVETPRADLEEITKYLGTRGGRIAGMIINKGRAKRGEKGLYGREMAVAVAAMIARRKRARGFLASGWVWAIRKLAPFAEKIGAPSTYGLRALGRAKGSAIPAVPGNKVFAKIANTVTAAWDKREGAFEKADPALQRAFDFERASMLNYMERKLQKDATRLAIKLLH